MSCSIGRPEKKHDRFGKSNVSCFCIFFRKASLKMIIARNITYFYLSVNDGVDVAERSGHFPGATLKQKRRSRWSATDSVRRFAGWHAFSPRLLSKGEAYLSGYRPRSSLIRITLTRPLGKAFSVMVQVLQMRLGLLQSSQRPVLRHGVFISSRMALTGAT